MPRVPTSQVQVQVHEFPGHSTPLRPTSSDKGGPRPAGASSYRWHGRAAIITTIATGRDATGEEAEEEEARKLQSHPPAPTRPPTRQSRPVSQPTTLADAQGLPFLSLLLLPPPRSPVDRARAVPVPVPVPVARSDGGAPNAGLQRPHRELSPSHSALCFSKSLEVTSSPWKPRAAGSVFSRGAVRESSRHSGGAGSSVAVSTWSTNTALPHKRSNPALSLLPSWTPIAEGIWLKPLRLRPPFLSLCSAVPFLEKGSWDPVFEWWCPLRNRRPVNWV
ncbi:hypothetical protein G7046_g3335 [Stylonectria norvegica]|nr:hypothetical protein G7046_g3335 [Stylonectria norvegica]